MPISSDRLAKRAAASLARSATKASVSMITWRWLRKYAGNVFRTMPSMPVGSSPLPGGHRRITLALRASFGAGLRVSSTLMRTMTSSPAASPSGARSRRCEYRRCRRSPSPRICSTRSVTVTFSPPPWASVTCRRAAPRP